MSQEQSAGLDGPQARATEAKTEAHTQDHIIPTQAEAYKKIQLLISALTHIRDPDGTFLEHLANGRTVNSKGWDGWDWTHGVALYALHQYYMLNPVPSTLSIIKSWFEIHLAAGTTKNINTMAAMLTLAHLYQDERDQQHLPHLEEWAEWAMHDLPRTTHNGFQHTTLSDDNHNQLWDDTLMMTVLPLAKIGLVLHRPAYVDEAKRQFLLHIQYLFDAPTGLFFHGWKFEAGNPKRRGHHFARARWARGNSWLTVAIPEMLDMLDLPSHDAFRIHLLATLEAQCQALKCCQRSSGLWGTLLDVSADEGSYDEASASAGFAFGILKAIRLGYLSSEYEDMAIRAVEAVSREIGEDGELGKTSFGTAMGWDLKHYMEISITSMPYGQALAMLMLAEYSRLLPRTADEI